MGGLPQLHPQPVPLPAVQHHLPAKVPLHAAEAVFVIRHAPQLLRPEQHEQGTIRLTDGCAQTLCQITIKAFVFSGSYS